tara:strand:- start:168 stop:614 length:447 start_codon:yes stop_codon:yes gene_type:complete
MSFSAQITDFVVNAAKKNPKRVRDAVLLKLFTSYVKDSPVDTGRFRGNWNTNIGTPELKTSSARAKVGGAPIERAKKTFQQSEMSQTIYLTNNLPYARVLEFGGYKGTAGKTASSGSGIFSKQAPAGMVRVNNTRFDNLIKAEAAKVS